jgi:spartin
MLSLPEAFVLLSLPDATLKSTGFAEVGVLNLECVTLPIPEAKSAGERTVYLVLKLNNFEIPIDPDRVVECTDVAGTRTYTFAQTPSDPTHLTLTLKGPRPGSSDVEFVEKLDTFDNILEQYVVNFKGTSVANGSDLGAPTSVYTTGIGSVTSNKDLRGHLVMINEETGEVVGEVEDRFRIREDPVMYEKGHENEPVIIEVAEESNIESDANALEAFARMVPPDQRNWITQSASVVRYCAFTFLE